jgi:hypothetical protein
MGTMAVFSDDVLLLLMALAALTITWWVAAVWWTVRRSNWRYGLLTAVSAALLMLAGSILLASVFEDSFWFIAVLWTLLPPAVAWGSIGLATRRNSGGN